jgi:hypothetical protein
MNLLSFGYGNAVCPQCFDGEDQIIFLDNTYWLNRLISRFIQPKPYPKKIDDYDEILLEQAQVSEDMEISQEFHS